MKEIKEDSKELKEYIKTYILPNESQQERIDYLKGNTSYDLDYLKEHIKHNTLVNYKLIEQQKPPLMYKGWIVKQRKDSKTFYAYNLATDKYINPLFKDWQTLKKFIDAMN
tara:strand:- start:372 stop:704 length:333 start_codon:yes stop_codon:yes gene_type:complete